MMLKQNSNDMVVKRSNVKSVILMGSLTLLLLLQIVFDMKAYAGFTIRPSLTLSEEYDDNIFLTRDKKESDFVTRAMPSVSMNYGTPFWDWTFDYTLEWWYYAKQGEGGDSHNANLVSRTRLVENFLYLDLNDTYSNVVVDPRQPSTETNLDVNRTDQNNLLASLYIKYQISPSVILSAGYLYTNIWYREDTGVNRQLHTGFAVAEYRFSPEFRAQAGAAYTADMPDEENPDNKRMVLFVKTFYKMGPRTDFDGTLGYRLINFDGSPDSNRVLYNAGIVYRISEQGQIEFRAASGADTTLADLMNLGISLLYSPSLGVYESRTEQITIRYGEALSVNGSVYHRKDTYLETDQRDEAFGVAAGLQYRYSPRLTFRIGGRYEQIQYDPEDEERTVFNGSAGIGYQLTPKADLTLTYNHTRENGRTSDLDYTNNVIAILMRMTF